VAEGKPRSNEAPRGEIERLRPGPVRRRQAAGALPSSSGRVPAPILLLLGLVVAGGIGAPGPLQEVAWANHRGPERYVDVSAPPAEDADGDLHFRTLTAALSDAQPYDTIWVDPGRYREDLVLEVEGVTVRATRGPAQTVWIGRVIVRARDVRLEGVTIEAPPESTGLTIEAGADGAAIENVRVSGGRVGIAIEGAGRVLLRDVRIYNHAQDGLVLRNAWAVTVEGAQLRGNGGLGAWVENSQEISLLKSEIALNGMGGLWLKRVRGALIEDNAIENNDLVGLLLEETTDSQVVENRVTSGEAGILLLNASGNEIRRNEIRGLSVVGLGLKNRSQGNVVAENLIRGNQGRGAVGLRLVGDVSQNRFEDNRILENSLGVLLGVNETGGPSGNVFAGNELARSDWVGALLDPGTTENRFVRNRIYENLDEGLVVGSEGDRFEANEIYANGGAGMALNRAQDALLVGNAIYGNGAAGLVLQGAVGITLAENEVVNNVREGVRIEGGRLLRMQRNEIAQNGADGLFLRGAEVVVLEENELRANRERGAAFVEAREVALFGNTIVANGAGGVHVERVVLGDLERNRVASNIRFGLYVLASEGIEARRNFWGDETGPSGFYTGRGDAVLGLSREDVTPWLPADPDALLLRSMASLVLDSPRGSRIQLDATDRLGLRITLYPPGRSLPGRSEWSAEGVLIVGRYAERPEGVPPLDAEMGFYAVALAGLDAGIARIEVFYREEDQPPELAPEKLRLLVFRDRDGRWVPLPGSANPELQRVTGEIPLGELAGAILALGIPADIADVGVDAHRREHEASPSPLRPEPETDFSPPTVTPSSAPPASTVDGLTAIGLLGVPFLILGLYLLGLSLRARFLSRRKARVRCEPGL